MGCPGDYGVDTEAQKNTVIVINFVGTNTTENLHNLSIFLQMKRTNKNLICLHYFHANMNNIFIDDKDKLIIKARIRLWKLSIFLSKKNCTYLIS